MITPNPDTNPELFEKLTVGQVKQRGDIFRPFRGGDWLETETYYKPVDTHSYTYYRRKTTTQKEPMKIKWNPTANGEPNTSRTVIVTSLIASTLNHRPSVGVERVQSAFWQDYDRTWRDARHIEIPAPAFWAEIPEGVEPLKEKPIQITSATGTHTVEFLSNGDVRVGCTTVPSITMDQIEARREEVKKS